MVVPIASPWPRMYTRQVLYTLYYLASKALW